MRNFKEFMMAYHVSIMNYNFSCSSIYTPKCSFYIGFYDYENVFFKPTDTADPLEHLIQTIRKPLSKKTTNFLKNYDHNKQNQY